MSIPMLLEKLDVEQRLRVLSLDYVTACGFVPPEDWLVFSALIEHYLRTGEIALPEAKVHRFPRSVE